MNMTLRTSGTSVPRRRREPIPFAESVLGASVLGASVLGAVAWGTLVVGATACSDPNTMDALVGGAGGQTGAPTGTTTGSTGTGGTNGPATGGLATGGLATGGLATGGLGTGGLATGGLATGGLATGGLATGGLATGGRDTGGDQSGGANGTGGRFATGGRSNTGGRFNTGGQGDTGGRSGTGGQGAGGQGAGGLATGGLGTGGLGPPEELPKFVGNITTYDRVDTDGEVFATYWDQITPENAGKWGSVERSSGSFNWGTLDSIYDYTQEHGIIFKQHAFVWGTQQPNFSIGETEVKRWMNAFCERYPGTAIIDVVNEPPPHQTPNYANSIGGGTNGSWQWIINAFEWADEACPNAILVLNDFNNIEWEGDNNHFIGIVKTLQAAGAPIDAIGAQAHDLDIVNFSTVSRLLAKLHNDTGLPIYITEYDPSTSDDAAQLRMYQEHVAFFMEAEYVRGITIWGWIYGKTWNLAPESGLIRNGSPRSAMTWLMQELGRPVP